MTTQTEQKDGGAAFPVAMGSLGDQYDCGPGMSLRDWFAGQALPWCLAEFGGNAEDQRQFAEAAYQIADAMLAERAARKTEGA